MRCFESERKGDRSALGPIIAKATEPFCLAIADAIAAASSWPALGSPATRAAFYGTGASTRPAEGLPSR
jgi:hypothetical protein